MKRQRWQVAGDAWWWAERWSSGRVFLLSCFLSPFLTHSVFSQPVSVSVSFYLCLSVSMSMEVLILFQNFNLFLIVLEGRKFKIKISAGCVSGVCLLASSVTLIKRRTCSVLSMWCSTWNHNFPSKSPLLGPYRQDLKMNPVWSWVVDTTFSKP